MKKKKLLFAIMTMASLACHAVVDGRYGKAELSATTDGGVVTEIAFFTPEIVNVRHFKTEATATKRNLVVTLDKQDVAVNVSDDGDDAVVLTSSAMSVRYEKSTGCVAFFDLGGNQLLTEKSGQTVLTARKDGNDDSLYDGIASKGADAYWMDSSEPDHYQGGAAMEETFDFVTGMGCTWRSVRNAFPLVHVGGVYDHHRAEPSLAEKRCLILTRSGYAGLQRYGANTWSGDITASWTTLANEIPAALSYSICGNPNWNSDTGAFFNGDLQGPGNDKAIYVWGKRGNKYFDNEEKYIHLRYSLLPYIYSTAWDVHANGHSFMNPMAVMFPQDDKTHLLKDQFMIGQ